MLDRQGLLKGDLNGVQRIGLTWLMGQEIDDQVAIERTRMESFALAANPATSSAYLDRLFKQKAQKVIEEEFEDEEVEWKTPQSAEEAKDIANALGFSFEA